MDDDQQTPTPQVCHIDILFPVTSDEQALEVKRIISDALKDVKQKRVRFSITEG